MWCGWPLCGLVPVRPEFLGLLAIASDLAGLRPVLSRDAPALSHLVVFILWWSAPSCQRVVSSPATVGISDAGVNNSASCCCRGRGRDGDGRLQMAGRRIGGVDVRAAGIVAHSTLRGWMQVGVVTPEDCPQAIHRIIPNMWIIICVIHTVIPTMWITRFSIHISWHPRVVQVNGVRTSARTTAGCAP